MQSKKPVILVTGSSRGIGAGIAKHFGSLGYKVIITYKTTKTAANEVVSEISNNSGHAKAYQLDVTSEESVMRLFSEIETGVGSLDILVNNAAVDWAMPIGDATFDDWKTITRTKIDGNFLCTKYALPLLKKSKNGNIIMIVSSLYDKVDPDDPAYCVGTAGVVAFMKAMSISLTKFGIRTNGIAPSEVRTQSRYWLENGSEQMWKEITEKNPMGRLCTPLDVACAIQMVVEDSSRFINGNIIYVTGGNHLK